MIFINHCLMIHKSKGILNFYNAFLKIGQNYMYPVCQIGYMKKIYKHRIMKIIQIVMIVR